MSPMKRLFGVGKFILFWAERKRFTHPGIHLWTGKRHIRLLAVPR